MCWKLISVHTNNQFYLKFLKHVSSQLPFPLNHEHFEHRFTHEEDNGEVTPCFVNYVKKMITSCCCGSPSCLTEQPQGAKGYHGHKLASCPTAPWDSGRNTFATIPMSGYTLPNPTTKRTRSHTRWTRGIGSLAPRAPEKGQRGECVALATTTTDHIYSYTGSKFSNWRLVLCIH